VATVTYQYEPNDKVWAITSGDTCPSAIRDGIVSHVRINITAITGSPNVDTQILYDIILNDENGVPDNGATTFIEDDVFATKAAAGADYFNRLGSP